MISKRHNNFYIVEAENNFELGLLLGKKFGNFARAKIDENKKEAGWILKVEQSRKYLSLTENSFPLYIEELQGYAKGAGVEFIDLWTISLEDEISLKSLNKCTTIITNKGKLFSHNEDWEKGSDDCVCLLLKRIGKLSILEIYYFDTLGGNSISINSNGFVVSVNALVQRDRKIGIPRDVIARFLSETNNPEDDFLKLKNMPRSVGYNFNIVNKEGKIWNIEYNSVEAILTKPESPYVHTNHCLSELKLNEIDDDSGGTFDRYEVANSKIKEKMVVSELIDLTNDSSRGNIKSIMNERTIAKIIVDLEKLMAYVWLRREGDKGWLEYDLDKLLN